MFQCLSKFKYSSILIGIMGLAYFATSCSTISNIIDQPSVEPMKTSGLVTYTLEPSVRVVTSTLVKSVTATPNPTPNGGKPTPVILDSSKTNLVPTGTLLLISDVGYEMTLIDVWTEEEKKLFPKDMYAKFEEWRDNGCKLLVRTDEGEYGLVSLQGDWNKTLFSYSSLKKLGLDPYGYRIFLSPDDKWLWFWRVSGQPYDEMGPESRYEIQDIYTISTDLTEGPYQLTKNGGGWIANWSPNGEYIAFTDFDSTGVAQVYISSVRGERIQQVTFFNQPSSINVLGTDILKVDWSPDGEHLAVNYSVALNEKIQESTVIIDSKTIETKFEQANSAFLWWVDDSRFLLETTNVDGDKFINAHVLGSNATGPYLMEWSYPNFLQIRPFTRQNLVGFFALANDWQFYVFNSEDGSVYTFPKIKYPIDTVDWTSTPLNFPGLDTCKQ